VTEFPGLPSPKLAIKLLSALQRIMANQPSSPSLPSTPDEEQEPEVAIDPKDELKRQQRELARIRREMKAPMSKRSVLMVAISLSLVALVAVGAYYFACFYRVSLWANTFMDNYNNSELTMIKRFAPTRLAKVENLKKSAKSGSMPMETREICKRYKEANDALQDAMDFALEGRRKYESALQEFETLRDEAAAKKLETYAPNIWERIQNLRKEAKDETDSAFNPTHAIEKLHEAVEILENTQESYDAIKAYNEAQSAYMALGEALIEAEWAENCPDDLASLKSVTGKAESAAQAGSWSSAAKGYTAASAIIKPREEELSKIRDKAKAVVTRFRDACDASRADLSKNARGAWSKITTQLGAVSKHEAAYEYAEQEKEALAGIALIEEIRGTVAEEKSSRTKRLKKLVQTYQAVYKHDKFLRANWKDEWQVLQDAYRGVPALIKSEDFLALLKEVNRLQTALDDVIVRREELLKETAGTRAKLDVLEKNAVIPLLGSNFPKEFREFRDLKTSAERALRRSTLVEATEFYGQATALLGKLIGELEEIRGTSAQLLKGCRERRSRFEAGIRAFRADSQDEMDSLIEQGAAYLGEKNYRLGLPKLRKASELLPTSRFTFEMKGTAVDNEKALMWARDGNSPGCYSGKACTWQEADTWVRTLRFASYEGWRLPTFDELQTLLRMPPEQRESVFPNTKTAVYWSGTYDRITDVDRMLAIDFQAGRNVKKNKQEKHFVRPIRLPR